MLPLYPTHFPPLLCSKEKRVTANIAMVVGTVMAASLLAILCLRLCDIACDTGGMKTSEEKRWERMQQQLLAESSGSAPVRLSSQRTLFGIKSHVEEVIEAVVAEDRAKCEENLRHKKNPT